MERTEEDHRGCDIDHDHIATKWSHLGQIHSCTQWQKQKRMFLLCQWFDVGGRKRKKKVRNSPEDADYFRNELQTMNRCYEVYVNAETLNPKP